MINLVISLGGMEVDKMEKDEEGNNCPLATKDPEVNAENKAVAVEEANYREPNSGSAFVISETCGTCAAFNQTHDIMECIGNNPHLGYCQMFKFMCHEENTCDSWAEGGPITDADDGSDHDIL
jgi:hypothetical protein